MDDCYDAGYCKGIVNKISVGIIDNTWGLRDITISSVVSYRLLDKHVPYGCSKKGLFKTILIQNQTHLIGCERKAFFRTLCVSIITYVIRRLMEAKGTSGKVSVPIITL